MNLSGVGIGIIVLPIMFGVMAGIAFLDWVNTKLYGRKANQ